MCCQASLSLKAWIWAMIALIRRACRFPLAQNMAGFRVAQVADATSRFSSTSPWGSGPVECGGIAE